MIEQTRCLQETIFGIVISLTLLQMVIGKVYSQDTIPTLKSKLHALISSTKTRPNRNKNIQKLELNTTRITTQQKCIKFTYFFLYITYRNNICMYIQYHFPKNLYINVFVTFEAANGYQYYYQSSYNCEGTHLK